MCPCSFPDHRNSHLSFMVFFHTHLLQSETVPSSLRSLFMGGRVSPHHFMTLQNSPSSGSGPETLKCGSSLSYTQDYSVLQCPGLLITTFLISLNFYLSAVITKQSYTQTTLCFSLQLLPYNLPPGSFTNPFYGIQAAFPSSLNKQTSSRHVLYLISQAWPMHLT